MPPTIYDALFNIALNAFRHATLGCLLDVYSHTRAMGRFMDVVWYDLNIPTMGEKSLVEKNSFPPFTHLKNRFQIHHVS